MVRLKIINNAKSYKYKKSNIKKRQTKHYQCPKYIRILRPDLYNLQTRKEQLKKLLKIGTDPSTYLTAKNLQYQHGP